MKHPNLRIAWSITWGMVCCLLIALWLGSYGVTPFSKQIGNSYFTVSKGYICGVRHPSFVHRLQQNKIRITTDSHTTRSPSKPVKLNFPFDILGHRLFWFAGWSIWVFHLPILSSLVFCCLLASLPWLRWHFSLRTLLIATTILAILLTIAAATSSRG